MTREERDEAYFQAFKSASEELAELLELEGQLQGKMNANRIRQAQLKLALKRLEKQQETAS